MSRLCHRPCSQVNYHQPSVHVPSRFQKRMSVRHQVESGAPFNANRDLRVDIVIERGGLRDASASGFRHKSILIDVTYADPQAGVHLRHLRGTPFTDSLSDLSGRYSRRVHRYKLTLRGRQATRGRREEEGGLMPMAWGCHIDVE